MFNMMYPCGACGVPVLDVALHTRYHENLAAMARAILAPHATDEEWAELQVQAQAAGIMQQAMEKIQREQQEPPPLPE